MLTFEKVLEIFSDYLMLDQELEVCKSRYGYIRVEFSFIDEDENIAVVKSAIPRSSCLICCFPIIGAMQRFS